MLKNYKKILPNAMALALLCLSNSLLIAQDCNFDKQSKHGHEQVNAKIYDYLSNQENAKNARITSLSCPSRDNDTLKIPVVVHLVYNSNNALNTKANLSDATVKGLIDDWNLRFTKKTGRTYTNPYSGVETKIKFVLATRDPQGNATSGILHHPDNVLAVTTSQENDTIMKKKYGWNSFNYFNFYVLDTCYSTSAGALAGYAFFPSTHGTVSDGAVFQGNYVWKGFYYNTGLMAHETGHYLGLYHSFTDAGTCTNNNCMQDGDQVCDTPPKNVAAATGTSCTSPGNSCNSDTVDTDPRNPFRSKKIGGLGDQPDGNELYMDYTGGCWGVNYSTNNVQTGAFTVGQMNRMRATLLTLRQSLLTSPALVPFNSNEIGINKLVSPASEACIGTTPLVFNVSNLGSSTITTFQYTISINGVAGSAQTWQGSLTSNQSVNVTSPNITLANGANIVTITLNLNGDNYLVNNTLCTSIQYNLPITSNNFVNNFESTTTGWTSQNPDGLVGFANYSLNTCAGKGNSVLGYLSQPTSVASTGTNDYLVSDAIDLSNFTTANLSFDYAHKGYYSNRQLNLAIEVSQDCGLNYTSLWSYATNTGLSTVLSGGVYTAFTPASCNDWKNINVNLLNYVGKKIKLRFNANVVSYGAQNLFIDNIALTGNKTSTGLENNLSDIEKMAVYPNPFSNQLTIVSPNNDLVIIDLMDITGNVIFSKEVVTNEKFELNTHLSQGIYFVKVSTKNGSKILKLMK